jgi:hypothetical protein
MNKEMKNIYHEIIKTLEEEKEKKRNFAKKNHFHLFNPKTKKCVFCGRDFEDIKKEVKPLEIEYDKDIASPLHKIIVYPNCKGDKNDNRKV